MNNMKYLIIRADAERSFASTTTGTQTGNCFLALLQRWQMRAPSAMHGYLDGESFHPASDHIADHSKKVVGGDGEVTQSCAALVYGRRRWGRSIGERPLFLWRWVCANISAITRREANRGAMMSPAMPKAAFIQVMNRGVGAESQGSYVTLTFAPWKRAGRCSSERARRSDSFVRPHVHARCDRPRGAPWRLTC